MPNLIYGQERPEDGGHSRPVLIDNQRRLVVTGDGGVGGPPMTPAEIHLCKRWAAKRAGVGL